MHSDAHRQFGYMDLGPIINEFMGRMHASLRLCNAPDCKALFAMRAGLRIWQLYQTWLSARRTEPLPNAQPLKISRLMAIKASYGRAPALAIAALTQEKSNRSLRAVVKSLLRSDIANGHALPLSDLSDQLLGEFLASDDAVARHVRAHLEEQSAVYERYLKRLMGESKRVFLIDSGWRGTSQLLLEEAFSEYQWEGLYFGCIGRAEILGKFPKHMHGLVFDSTAYEPSLPETAFILHRHIIEGLLEPEVPSVECLDPSDATRPPTFASVLASESPSSWDAVHLGVQAYLAEHAADSVTDSLRTYEEALRRVADLICYPTPDDVAVIGGQPRSMDLGEDGAVPSVFPVEDRFEGDSSDLRIAQAIWATGQAAIETRLDRRKARQDRIVSGFLAHAPNQYFHAPTDEPGKASAADASVAIITRTKDRPLLLRRAAESVASQTHKNYTWVVVNDGGELSDVLDVVNSCTVDPSRIVVCSNAKSLGMEAASNIGIGAAHSEFIVIHDDDDSWHPDFLSETLSFLRRNQRVYGGVITHSVYISEEIQGDQVIEHSRSPYNPWVRNVHIVEMLAENFFPPIAFVFRRCIWETLGGFSENLPVLGDWDFNIRFLLEADIGVIPTPLAHYHHRDKGGSGSYSNSVAAGVDRHIAYNAIVRNNFIRQSAKNPSLGFVSVLTGLGHAQNEIRHRFHEVNKRLDQPAAPVKDDTAVRESALNGDRRWAMLIMMAHQLTQVMQVELAPEKLLEGCERAVDGFILTYPFIPPPDFNEKEYLRLYPDVVRGMDQGQFASGYDHYIKHGLKEGRQRPTNRLQASKQP